MDRIGYLCLWCISLVYATGSVPSGSSSSSPSRPHNHTPRGDSVCWWLDAGGWMLEVCIHAASSCAWAPLPMHKLPPCSGLENARRGWGVPLAATALSMRCGGRGAFPRSGGPIHSVLGPTCCPNSALSIRATPGPGLGVWSPPRRSTAGRRPPPDNSDPDHETDGRDETTRGAGSARLSTSGTCTGMASVGGCVGEMLLHAPTAAIRPRPVGRPRSRAIYKAARCSAASYVCYILMSADSAQLSSCR